MIACSRVEIVIEGMPMPKQSFKIGKYKNFTPKKTKDKINNVIEQIKAQLPEDFEIINQPVILSYTVLYPFTRAFEKKIVKDQIVKWDDTPWLPVAYKATRPDLDNLIKLYNDCLNELVIQDDSLIVGYDRIRKFYSKEARVLLTITVLDVKKNLHEQIHGY